MLGCRPSATSERYSGHDLTGFIFTMIGKVAQTFYSGLGMAIRESCFEVPIVVMRIMPKKSLTFYFLLCHFSVRVPCKEDLRYNLHCCRGFIRWLIFPYKGTFSSQCQKCFKAVDNAKQL